MSDETIMPFDFPQDNPTIIKVIGVGGGGGNAVNHMYKEGIHDVTFVVCNTDNQALAESPVPVKLQLGKEGLGAGNRPARAREAAEESIEDVKHMLNDGCKMVFITAGMGGGTGTGAAPIIAKTAKDMDILTVGIVTIPFLFEGNRKIDQALDGVEQMSQHVDALLVINNERLRDIYSDFSVMNAFGKADDTLSVAAKSIAEIITIRGTINLDFNDVKTVLKDGGVAIMSTGYGEGENRVSQAINDALHSPLLNNNDIFNSKKILFNISFSTKSELMCLDAILTYRHGLQIRKNLLFEEVPDELRMHGLHLLLALVKHHMLLFTQSRNQLAFINANTVFHLLIHHLGYLMNKMFCLFLSNIITVTARSNRFMFCHTYLIELFEIGRIY